MLGRICNVYVYVYVITWECLMGKRENLLPVNSFVSLQSTFWLFHWTSCISIFGETWLPQNGWFQVFFVIFSERRLPEDGWWEKWENLHWANSAVRNTDSVFTIVQLSIYNCHARGLFVSMKHIFISCLLTDPPI